MFLFHCSLFVRSVPFFSQWVSSFFFGSYLHKILDTFHFILNEYFEIYFYILGGVYVIGLDLLWCYKGFCFLHHHHDLLYPTINWKRLNYPFSLHDTSAAATTSIVAAATHHSCKRKGVEERENELPKKVCSKKFISENLLIRYIFSRKFVPKKLIMFFIPISNSVYCYGNPILEIPQIIFQKFQKACFRKFSEWVIQKSL